MQIVKDSENRSYDAKTGVELFPVYDDYTGNFLGYMSAQDVFYPVKEVNNEK